MLIRAFKSWSSSLFLNIEDEVDVDDANISHTRPQSMNITKRKVGVVTKRMPGF